MFGSLWLYWQRLFDFRCIYGSFERWKRWMHLHFLLSFLCSPLSFVLFYVVKINFQFCYGNSRGCLAVLFEMVSFGAHQQFFHNSFPISWIFTLTNLFLVGPRYFFSGRLFRKGLSVFCPWIPVCLRLSLPWYWKTPWLALKHATLTFLSL